MRILTIAILIILLSSCSDDPLEPIVTQGRRVLILNEGNFGWGEGTITAYYPTDNVLKEECFKDINGTGIGNVLQSALHIDSIYYFVVNNSAKVVATDSTLKVVKELTGLTSPRNLYQVSKEKAYLTDLYANRIWVIDLATFTVSGEIKVRGWCDNGLLFNDFFYLANQISDQIYMIDPKTDQLTDSFTVNYAPQSIVPGDNGIWILSQGGNSDPAQLAFFDLAYNKSDSLNIDGIPVHLRKDALTGDLFFVNEDIYKVEVSVPLSAKKFTNLALTVPYAFDIDPYNGDLYISDALDYVQKSTVVRISKEGSEIARFKSGIITGAFVF